MHINDVDTLQESLRNGCPNEIGIGSPLDEVRHCGIEIHYSAPKEDNFAANNEPAKTMATIIKNGKIDRIHVRLERVLSSGEPYQVDGTFES